MDELKAHAESASVEAMNSVAVTEEARQKAFKAQVAEIIRDTWTSFFATQTEEERFISTQRIPYICKDITSIKEDMKEALRLQSQFQEKLEMRLDDGYVTREAFWPVKVLVYGFVGLTLTAVIGAILALVIMNK